MSWVRRTDRMEQLYGRTRPGAGGCIEFTGYRSVKGYGEIKVDGRMEKAHRQAWVLHHGPIPEGMHVMHSCDNPPCVNIEHLTLGTNDDNVADRVAKGRSSRLLGERSTSAKLTEADVKAIRRMASLGMTNMEIAAEFNVSNQNVSQIVLRRTWKEVS